MAKYLHKFTSMADFQAAYDGQDYHEPWVSIHPQPLLTKALVYYEGSSLGDVGFTYIEERDVYDSNNDSTIHVYLWDAENYKYASLVRNLEVGSNFYYFDESNSSINTGSPDQVYDIDSQEYETSPSQKVTYNKHPFTGDLIIEGVNKRGGETGDITYANSDYFGELTCDGDCDEVAQYTCSGPISEGTGKEPLRVRVINVNEEQKDYVFELDYNGFPETNSMEWRCNDSSCPIYITYADYSGGSPIVLKANEV